MGQELGAGDLIFPVSTHRTMSAVPRTLPMAARGVCTGRWGGFSPGLGWNPPQSASLERAGSCWENVVIGKAVYQTTAAAFPQGSDTFLPHLLPTGPDRSLAAISWPPAVNDLPRPPPFVVAEFKPLFDFLRREARAAHPFPSPFHPPRRPQCPALLHPFPEPGAGANPPTPAAPPEPPVQTAPKPQLAH